MLPEQVLRVLKAVAAGTESPAAALRQLAWPPVESVAGASADQVIARVDHHRALRLGFPEVVFCEGKTTEQVVAICTRLAAANNGFLATRANAGQRAALSEVFPAAEVNDLARTVCLPLAQSPSLSGTILIATGGTADIPVAEEASVTARALGNPVEQLYDVGVAGIHRLLSQTEPLARASVIIVVAGMEGALASVMGGLVAVPVIAVPTSVGYGASFGGVAALLAMLNSCASGVTVVNIDNGFGAACAANRINRLLSGSGTAWGSGSGS
ncbi:MAG: nickel pincer cofactor biosynthesis protein LarB [Gemmatimonadota bacterium]